MAWVNRDNNRVRVKLKRHKYATSELNTLCSTIGCFKWFRATEAYQETCPNCRKNETL